tara:strand:+ start:180 stop:401 length:222 start_codon:yes stop_codon:yes gene_type:complete
MASTIITDVLIGKDARLFVSSVSVDYEKQNLKDMIFDPKNDNNFLLLTKEIGSKIKIKDVKVVDDSFIESAFS